MPINVAPRNGSSRVATPATVEAGSAWSAYWWSRRASGTGGQPWSLGTSGTPYFEAYYSGSTTDRLHVERLTSGTQGRWFWTVAAQGIAYSASEWVWHCVVQSGTAAPVLYTASPQQGVPLASRGAPDVLQSPTGTASTSAGQVLYLGNYNAFDYALGGDLAWVGLHNVALSPGEVEEAFLRGFTLRGLVFASPLEAPGRLFDLSGAARTLTATGVADASPDPPVLPLWVPTAAPLAPVAPGTSVVPVSALIAAASTVTAAPRRRRTRAATVAAASTVTAAPHKAPKAVAALVAATSSVLAAVSRRGSAVVSVAASAIVSITPRRRRQVAAGVAGSSAVTAAVRRSPRTVAMTVAGSSTVTAAARRAPRKAAMTVAAASSVAAAPRALRRLAVTITASANVAITPPEPATVLPTVAIGVYP